MQIYFIDLTHHHDATQCDLLSFMNYIYIDIIKAVDKWINQLTNTNIQINKVNIQSLNEKLV